MNALCESFFATLEWRTDRPPLVPLARRGQAGRVLVHRANWHNPHRLPLFEARIPVTRQLSEQRLKTAVFEDPQILNRPRNRGNSKRIWRDNLNSFIDTILDALLGVLRFEYLIGHLYFGRCVVRLRLIDLNSFAQCRRNLLRKLFASDRNSSRLRSLFTKSERITLCKGHECHCPITNDIRIDNAEQVDCILYCLDSLSCPFSLATRGLSRLTLILV